MENNINISYGFYTSKGIKEINQDYCGILIPKEPLLTTKGIAIAICDGISSSKVSHEASHVCAQSFLEDYYCTSEAWSVKNSATKVINATNSWLYAKNKENQYHLEKDSGYVCTFSSLILKSTTAHIFNIGDSRVYRLRNKELQQLTSDHRTWVSKEKSYLSRAMGIDSIVNSDYASYALQKEDIFLLSTDGFYEFIDEKLLIEEISSFKEDYNLLAQKLIQTALTNGSDDNLTLQIVKIENLPNQDVNELQNEIFEKSTPQLLNEGESFDGFKVLKKLSSSSRSHVYLVQDEETNEKLVLKAPSYEFKNDIAYLERFLLEDWIAKRIKNTYVLKAHELNRPKNYLYLLTKYVQGETLTQWMRDNPNINLQEAREIIEQIANGLQAFHTLEMVHQDLRPENILIDKDNKITIIDFGATKVEGINEIDSFTKQHNLQGTALYSAPEYFLGDEGTNKSDIFSLAVITYQMLSGNFPYGTNIAKSTTKSAQNKLKYMPLTNKEIAIPKWFDETLKKALSINPNNRYNLLSEFIYDLKIPNKKFLGKNKIPIMEKDPVTFWKVVSFSLFILNIILLLKERT